MKILVKYFHCYQYCQNLRMMAVWILLNFFIGSMEFKVWIFWEGHKVWKNLPLKIWRFWVVSNFKWKIFSNLWPSENIQTLLIWFIFFYIKSMNQVHHLPNCRWKKTCDANVIEKHSEISWMIFWFNFAIKLLKFLECKP